MEKALDVARPQLVLIDSLRSYRPDVTDKNSAAGGWLLSIRKLSKKYHCAFLVVHHLRKPGENAPASLRDVTVATWLQEMEGPRGFFNQTDVRIAIAASDGRESSPASLEMKWARRVHGDSPLVSLERVFNGDGDPIGYRHLTGPSLLDAPKREVLARLPEEFSTADAKTARRECRLGDGNDPTNKFLAECKQLRIIERLGRGQWRKVAS